MLLVDPLTSQLLRDPALDLAFSRTCNPALLCVDDHAKSFDRTALAIRYRRSALWEYNLQSFKDQLNPTVFFDRQDCNDFRASSNDDCDNSSGRRVHDQQTGGLASSLDTRCSTPLSLVNVSLRSSFISLCKTSSCVAMCSTALVRRITASRASSDLRLKPIAPIAATEIEAPATAAMTSIMTATGYKGSLSTLPAQWFLATTAWSAVLTKTLPSRLGTTGLVFQSSGAGFCLGRHQLAQGTPDALDGARCSSI